MENNELDLSSIFSEVNELISQTDLSKVSAESTGFDDLPDGYYLAEVVESKIGRSKKSNKPMVSIRFKIVGNGYKLNGDVDDPIADLFEPIEHVENRQVFKHWLLDSSQNLKRFVSDMKKFEDPEEVGKPLLPEEAWTKAETMNDSIEVLSQLNSRIWLHNKVTKKDDGTSSSWVDLESFGRIAKLGLPVD